MTDAFAKSLRIRTYSDLQGMYSLEKRGVPIGGVYFKNTQIHPYLSTEHPSIKTASVIDMSVIWVVFAAAKLQRKRGPLLFCRAIRLTDQIINLTFFYGVVAD